METYSEEQLRKAVEEAIEQGPRDEEELTGYGAIALLGQEAYDELSDPEYDEVHDLIRRTAEGMGLNPTTGEYQPPTKPKKATRTKKTTKAKKAEVKYCLCGCGAEVSRRFRQGHDAKLLSMLKKVERGEMTKEELQERGVDLEAVAR